MLFVAWIVSSIGISFITMAISFELGQKIDSYRGGTLAWWLLGVFVVQLILVGVATTSVQQEVDNEGRMEDSFEAFMVKAKNRHSSLARRSDIPANVVEFLFAMNSDLIDLAEAMNSELKSLRHMSHIHDEGDTPEERAS